MKTNIKCISMEGGILDSNNYTTNKGNVYTFWKGKYTSIDDPEDALFFLQAGKGKFFVAEGIIEKVIESLKSAIKTIAPKETKKDEPKLEVKYEDIHPEGDIAPLEGEKVKLDINKPIATREELKKLTKAEQETIIKKVDPALKVFPRTEFERIELILKYQHKDADIMGIIKQLRK